MVSGDHNPDDSLGLAVQADDHSGISGGNQGSIA